MPNSNIKISQISSITTLCKEWKQISEHLYDCISINSGKTYFGSEEFNEFGYLKIRLDLIHTQIIHLAYNESEKLELIEINKNISQLFTDLIGLCLRI